MTLQVLFLFPFVENCKLYNEGLPYQKLEVINMDIGSFLIGVGLTMAATCRALLDKFIWSLLKSIWIQRKR